MVILKYKEYLLTQHPREAIWVYDLCTELPEWDAKKEEYVFRKKPKRIDARDARRIIAENGLVCVCNNKYGMIYK